MSTAVNERGLISRLAERRVAVHTLAWSRMALGAWLYLRPPGIGRVWIGEEGTTRKVAVITRAYAGRELALGLGLLLALRRGAPVRGWIEASMLSDAGDTVASLIGPLGAGRRLGLALGCSSGVVLGFWALQEENARAAQLTSSPDLLA